MLQRSDEWFQARLGRVTASRVSDVVARTKTGWGASRANYKAQLIVERLTGKPTEGYVNGAMQHGIDTEDEARAAYEFYTDQEVEQVGFILHPELTMAGASPDGLIGSSGLVELKCPASATHIETLLTEKFPDKYAKQCLWQLACTGRDWVDLVSYDPRMPPEMQLFVRRIERNDKLIAELEKEVRVFLAEVDDTMAKLLAKFPVMEQAA